MRRTAPHTTLFWWIALALVCTATPLTSAGGVESPLEAAALQELLHGTNGHREAWPEVPTLVVLTSVMNYTASDMSMGYVATDEQLSDDEVNQLTSDLIDALEELTAGSLTAFATISQESIPVGSTVRVLRKGSIVVGRYRAVRAATGTLGYSGRTTRRNGAITAAAIILDSDFDRDNELRQLLRTHELGHALGYNHVESRSSVMNARIGSSVTDFDRAAARFAFQESAE